MPLPPLLRWAGSKRQHLSTFETLVPEFAGRYIEPFAGSACLFWHLEPSRARIADMNSELIDCYAAVRDAPSEVFHRYQSWSNTPATYYAVRERFHSEEDRIARAACFLFLNRYCFNGLYRTSRDGRFNVPYGGSRTGSLPSIKQLETYAIRLQNAELVCGDFAATTSDVEAGDFVYLDPPFYTTATRVFNGYNSSPFASSDLDRFADTLDNIDRKGAFFVASYLDTPEIAAISRRWHEEPISVLRRMSGFKSGRKRANELVFSNFLPSPA